MVSGKDGRLENLDCYDFSMYTDGNETQDDVMIAYGLLLEADEVQSYVNLGMTLQSLMGAHAGSLLWVRITRISLSGNCIMAYAII